MNEFVKDLEELLYQRFEEAYSEIPYKDRFSSFIVCIPNFDVLMNSLRYLPSRYLIYEKKRSLLLNGNKAGVHFVVEGQNITATWVEILESFRKVIF